MTLHSHAFLGQSSKNQHPLAKISSCLFMRTRQFYEEALCGKSGTRLRFLRGRGDETGGFDLLMRHQHAHKSARRAGGIDHIAHLDRIEATASIRFADESVAGKDRTIDA